MTAEWDPYARLLTALDASRAVDRPYPTIRRWIAEGKLKPFASQGTKKFYLESDVIALDAVTLGPHPHRAAAGAMRAEAAAKLRAQTARARAAKTPAAIERAAKAKAEKERTTVVCLMPGCTMTRSPMPELHLCTEHLAIVHDAVDHLEATNHRKRMDAFNAAWPAVVTPPKPGDIYYVKSDGLIKIGWTSNLAKRMRQYAPNSQLLATHPGTRADEQRLHKRFAVHRSHGREWYPLAPVILHHIDMMKAKYGEPDTVAFGAQPVTIPQHRDPQIIKARYSRSSR